METQNTGNQPLTNRVLDNDSLVRLAAASPEGEPILYLIVSDISALSKYAVNVLSITPNYLFSYNLTDDIPGPVCKISEIETVTNKRMYGNGFMRLEMKNGEKVDIFRFTFTVTTLCDAVITYVQEKNDGVADSEIAQMMEMTFTKLLSICPKCPFLRRAHHGHSRRRARA